MLTGDFDGSQAAETTPFSLDGTDYSIELSAANAAKMRQALRPFIDAGRRVPRRGAPHGAWTPTHHLARPRTVSRTDRGGAGRVRAWRYSWHSRTAGTGRTTCSPNTGRTSCSARN
ncbi:histone-like nucleoid-structuring protein Lsr2 [Streptomyces niveus]|uniref:Lsr2 dimerization domain-containing protein n=1 Tax=Streptomyces niveus TaxID=193462 RepID=UPI00371583C5